MSDRFGELSILSEIACQLINQIGATDALPGCPSSLHVLPAYSVCHRVVRKPLVCLPNRVRVGDPTVEGERLLVSRLGGYIVGAVEGEVAQALDAVGLAEHVADLLVE